MPTFEVTVNEFLNECYSLEIQELLKALETDGHIRLHNRVYVNNHDVIGGSVSHQEYYEAIGILADSYFKLSIEDTETIKNIAKKY